MTSTFNPVPLALTYFRAPQEYFWHWVEQGEILEWRSGATICYRAELVQVLQALAPSGLPSLGTLLLLLAACQGGWPEASGGVGLLHGLLQGLPPDDTDTIEVAQMLEEALEFLHTVGGLPQELRSGPRKPHLLHEVLRGEYRQITADWAGSVVDEWTSGRLDAGLLTPGPPPTRQRFLVDIGLLARAARRFPTVASLELRVRTGLNQLPEPLALIVPNRPTELFEELALDERTAGLARLAQRLGAALRIPLHAHGASNQPFGGVSDVTNRGSFDRLLLSELAYDDLTFTARLVNNEALYLRREEPPHNQPRPRTILLDTSLPMWGLPRLVALAAALAWARQSALSRPPATVAAYALGGQAAEVLTLETKAGVIQALTLLDPALHCGLALERLMSEVPAAAETDTLLITDAGQLHQPAFAPYLAAARPSLRFLLTVDRGGQVHLYEYVNSHRVPVSTSCLELDELLFRSATTPVRPAAHPAGTPAFLLRHPSPLYFPTVGMYNVTGYTFQHAHLGVVGITEKRRVLFWPKKECGARELLPLIEEGEYRFGSDEKSWVFIVVSNPKQKRLVFYRLPLGGPNEAATTVDLSPEFGTLTKMPPITWRDTSLALWINGESVVFDYLAGTIVERTPAPLPTSPALAAWQLSSGVVKRHINNGYNVLRRVNRLGISNGQLLIEGYVVQVVENVHLKLHAHQQQLPNLHLATLELDTLQLTGNPRLLFRRLAWPDGSAAIVDPRGLLHLRSSDASIPEITLVLVLNKSSAAWAADEAVCGSSYFTGVDQPAGNGLEQSRAMRVPDFYTHYLQRFIDRIIA
ncbi:hypothetical protein K3G63_09660 [Hymenobacter sp. HSC-4F20]|uniref:hypothetical protein n=1 Tax=Hymenobacter sp. HSC-4F20 TaxID=2864135 RepID=UPI001C73C6BF|nr:hypothetical protein [Hymenobacter sp. HSC-4F20]MBX0290704.1 hypothetical protein [Hymenobacter sp. HSC-4F20]